MRSRWALAVSATLIAPAATAEVAPYSGSGTISPANPTLTYQGTTYVVSNPTPPVGSGGGMQFTPNCDDNICDRFQVAVANAPDDYQATRRIHAAGEQRSLRVIGLR